MFTKNKNIKHEIYEKLFFVVAILTAVLKGLMLLINKNSVIY